jgi:hypothetical protein
MLRKGQLGVQQRRVAVNFIDYFAYVRFFLVSNEQHQVVQLLDAIFEYLDERVDVQTVPRQYVTALIGQVQRLFDVWHKQTEQMVWYEI